MPAFFSNSSLADHESLIQMVGFLPIQKVITGLFNDFESFSKYIHGLLSGSRWVLPIMGRGNGPGGCNSSVAFYVSFLEQTRRTIFL